jgi:hypothetical protein
VYVRESGLLRFFPSSLPILFSPPPELTNDSHPFTQLADLANLTQPWSLDTSLFPSHLQLSNSQPPLNGFKNALPAVEVPIPLEDLEKAYCRATGRAYPIPEMVFARSWMLFRVRRFAVPISPSPFPPRLTKRYNTHSWRSSPKA